MAWTVIALQVFVPAALLAWLWRSGSSSRVAWIARATLVGAYLACIAIVGLWMFVPWPAPYLFLAVWVAAAIHSYWAAKSASWFPRASFGAWLATAAMTLPAAALIGLSVHALLGYMPPARPVALSFPLRDGVYAVENGGNAAAINAHLSALTRPTLRHYRGNSYAVDIVKLNALGMRASRLTSRDLSRYAIFGAPVYSPCNGNVLRAESAVADMAPPQRDRAHMAGNFVLLDCNGVVVLLAHLRQGSVRVTGGERVFDGQRIASVGNSGNTDEPHLHIHAQERGSDQIPFDANPLPLKLSGRYLVRNARVNMFLSESVFGDL
jgi:hypothetical protein